MKVVVRAKVARVPTKGVDDAGRDVCRRTENRIEQVVHVYRLGRDLIEDLQLGQQFRTLRLAVKGQVTAVRAQQCLDSRLQHVDVNARRGDDLGQHPGP